MLLWNSVEVRVGPQPALHLAPLLRMLERHGPLADADRSALALLPFRIKHFRPHRCIHPCGTPSASVGVLVAGVAARIKRFRDGSRQILAFHLPGDILDPQHLLLSTAAHEVVSIPACDVAFVPRAELLRLIASRPALLRGIMQEALVDMMMSHAWLANVGRRGAYARTAHLLCDIAHRLEALGLAANDRFELPISQADLGDALGITAVHVNRVLQQMRADGLIATDRKIVRLLDRPQLAAIAEFDPAYLHPECIDAIPEALPGVPSVPVEAASVS